MTTPSPSSPPTPGKLSRFAIWFFAFGYFACYIPYSSLTKAVTKGLVGGERGLAGFQVLPLSVTSSLVAMIAFVSIARWWKFAHHVQVGGISLPRPTRWTLLSGICTGLIIVTTTMAYTIDGVSIVFAMLLMRGGVLIISPIVDRITGRHVRWFSWTGLLLSLAALVVAFAEPVRPGTSRFAFNAILAGDIFIYLASYFVRLQFMSRLAKSDDPAVTKRYFVEEQMVATPSVLLILGGLALSGFNEDMMLLRSGFTEIFSTPVWGYVILMGLFSQGTGLFGSLILLDKSETAFAVPVNRSSSILAGIFAVLVLWAVFELSLPSAYRFAAAGIIILAILVLSLPTLLAKRPG